MKFFVAVAACFFLLLCGTQSARAQDDVKFLYFGLGASGSFLPLNAIDPYLKAYNQIETKPRGRQMTSKLSNDPLTVGGLATLGWKIKNQRLIYEARLGYKRRTFTASGTDSAGFSPWERRMVFDMPTVQIGYQFPLMKNKVAKITAGGSIDFSVPSLRTSLSSQQNSTNDEIARSLTIGTSFAPQFYLTPFRKGLLMFGFRPYFQWNFVPFQVSELGKALPQIEGAVKEPEKATATNFGAEAQLLIQFGGRKDDFITTFIKRIRAVREYKKRLRLWKKRPKAPYVLTLSGQVMKPPEEGEEEGEGIEALVLCRDTTQDKDLNYVYSARRNGKFSLFLTQNEDVAVILVARGYLPQKHGLNPLDKKPKKIHREYTLRPIEYGKPLRHLSFRPEESKEDEGFHLNEYDQQDAETIGEFLELNPSVKFEVVGYYDPRLSEAELQARWEALKNALYQQGLNKRKLETKWQKLEKPNRKKRGTFHLVIDHYNPSPQ